MYPNNEEARALVATCKNELEALCETEAVQGYAAQDEIEEAVTHLEAAIVDLDDAILNE